MAAGGSTKVVLAAMAANGAIAIAKFVAFLFTGSSAMLAESIHSVADTSNQGLLLLGGKRAKKVADDRFQFGYGRERYFWAFVVAMVLFAVGGLFSFFEGLEKIRHPHEIESLGWAFGVLIFAMIGEFFAFRTAVVESNKVRGDRTWFQFVRTSRAPELPVVLLEDAGAMFGLVLAFVGIGLAAITGDPVWDGIGTLAIGVLLIIISIVLTIEMKSLLIGEAATVKDIETIKKTVSSAPKVERVIDLRSQHIGPEELLIAGKLEFTSGLTNRQLSDAIDVVESALRDALPHTLQIYLEPDQYEADYVDADVVDTDAEEH